MAVVPLGPSAFDAPVPPVSLAPRGPQRDATETNEETDRMARTTVADREANRMRLLQAAADEFARKGIDGANINEISLAAGLAKGTVYNHFDSKEALFLAVVEQACSHAASGAEQVPELAPTQTRLRAVLEADVEWVREHEAFAKVLVREVLTGDESRYPRVLAAGAPLIERIAMILREGVARGEVRGEVPVEQLALMFTGLADLAFLQHWGSGGLWPALDDIPDTVVEMFMHGAAPR